MRIPTSVIVMTLVTAAPFALAVRDTLHPQPKHHHYDEDMTPEAETAQYEAEMRRMEEERQAEQARTKAMLASMLGDKGKLGPFFDNLALGAPEATAQMISERATSASDLVEFHFKAPDGKVDELWFDATGSCDELEQAVRGAWGDGTQWIDPETHTKTELDTSDNCRLGLSRYVEIEQFLDKTLTASIPLAALGRRLDALPGVLGEVQFAPGLAHMSGGATVHFTTDENNKILGMSTSFGAEVETDAVIRARLEKLLGKGTQDPDTGEWSWKGKTPVHYAYSDAHVYLDIGAP
jgi:hypothetical protein